jgi:hypothetical protein
MIKKIFSFWKKVFFYYFILNIQLKYIFDLKKQEKKGLYSGIFLYFHMSFFL